ncbi:MAG: PD40 domain-containing protein [Anaerolineae bacterium]|nr:PD40 domain-containing protein [Anaerolineae bacterium]
MTRFQAALAACALALCACAPVTPVAPTPTLAPIRIVPQGTILFSAAGADGVFSLYTMNADGSGRKVLFSAGKDDVIGGRWSPDGKQIVAAIERDGASQLYVMGADGSNARRITQGRSAAQPAWSPDGQAIVFVGAEAGQKDLYYVRADGTALRRLTTRKGEHEQPAWAPDGTRIAFVSNEDSQFGNYQLYVLELDPTGTVSQKTLLRNERVNFQFPAWSRDGARLAYASDATGVFDLYVLTVATAKSVALTKGADPAAQPVWSPDDALLAYTVNLARGYTLHLITAEGIGAVPIDLKYDMNEFFPDWKR